MVWVVCYLATAIMLSLIKKCKVLKIVDNLSALGDRISNSKRESECSLV